MYQRILIPIDGSATSQRALQEVIELGVDRIKVRLIYVVEEVYPQDLEAYEVIDSCALKEALHNTGVRTLTKGLKKLQGSGISAETALLNAPSGTIDDVINEDALNWKADLIIIGTHGRSGLSRLLLGSVAEDVLRKAPVPVLLVRA